METAWAQPLNLFFKHAGARGRVARGTSRGMARTLDASNAASDAAAGKVASQRARARKGSFVSVMSAPLPSPPSLPPPPPASTSGSMGAGPTSASYSGTVACAVPVLSIQWLVLVAGVVVSMVV